MKTTRSGFIHKGTGNEKQREKESIIPRDWRINPVRRTKIDSSPNPTARTETERDRDREREEERKRKAETGETTVGFDGIYRVAFILKACKFVASASCPECKREENDGVGGGGGCLSLVIRDGKSDGNVDGFETVPTVYPHPPSFPPSLLSSPLLPHFLRRLNISTMAKPSTTSIFNYYLRTNGWE